MKTNLSQSLETILRRVPKSINPAEVILFLLNYPQTPKEVSAEAKQWGKNVLQHYHLDDPTAIHEYVRHRLTHSLSDEIKTVFGKYYSPKGATDLVAGYIQPLLQPDTLLLDLCVGGGAFAQGDPTRFYGADIDAVAVQILRHMGWEHIQCLDALNQINLEAYGIPKDHRDVIIVGNPPYNDRTSINKRGSKGQSVSLVDPRVKATDVGISFMRAYFLLQPRAVAVLHPMTYLLKPSLFKKIANLGYRLEQYTIFSSRAFSTHGSNPFPYGAALWVPRDPQAQIEGREQPALTPEQLESEWQAIRQREFPVVEIQDAQVTRCNWTFRMANYKTIDEPATKINKYVSKQPSNIELYTFNYRDLNSLLAKGNLMNNQPNGVPVVLDGDGEELIKACAMNCIKRYWKSGKKPVDFILGNMSPIYPQVLVTGSLRYVAVIDAYLANTPKFQPGIEQLMTWVRRMIRQHPRKKYLYRFLAVIKGVGEREALQVFCTKKLKIAIAALR